MNLKNYLKDNFFNICLIFFSLMIILILLIIFNVNVYLIILIFIIIFIVFSICMINDFLKRRRFYNFIDSRLGQLDKKYLIYEVVKKTDFLEGNLLLDYLYEINKSFIEEINRYKFSSEEFKEYIELWCHEIKTPLATSKLIMENVSNKKFESLYEELEKIEAYVEQVLFYARSDTLEKDYIVNKVNLKEVVQNVVRRNKKELLARHIKIEVFNDDVFVRSDIKWLEFIINQVLINSIKYSKDNGAFIKIFVETNKNNIMLYVEDNGIGIREDELRRVFDKGFTGSNGRKKFNSTGIGLYLCKKLTEKLGLSIMINSKENVGTTLILVFANNSMMSNLN